MYNILIVEDEEAMRNGLKDNLEFEGYQTDTAEDGKIGLQKINYNNYDLIVMDVMMPNLSGFEVCKKIRAAGNKTPVILLTARGEEIDKILGLELGADDYITKPFSVRELIARIKAILRRTENINAPNITPNQFLQLGRLKLDFVNYAAYENDNEVSLTHREFELIKYLYEKRNQTVSRDDLLKNIWDQNVFTTTRTIDNFIVKLRQKIEDDPNHPKIILTVHGIGYKMIAK
ncbi:MAG TPA: response regulator transcription factor [Melioribacteraceae bacterium]|nr:response regulator transcription factor [Melioribacteraceae bacterium]